MYFGGIFLGLSSIFGANTRRPPGTYTEVNILGAQRAHFTQVVNKELTEEEIQNLLDTAPNYTVDTVLLAPYRNNLNGGNSIGLISPILAWRIFRRTPGSSISTLIGQVAPEIIEINDLTVQPNETYIYDIFGITADRVTDPVTTTPQTADIFAWYVIDEATQESMAFNIEINSGVISNVVDVTTHDTFSQFSTVAVGPRDYYRGTIRCYGGEIDAEGNLTNDLAYQERVRAFLNNNNVKIMKSRLGNTFRVKTYGANIQYYDDIGDQPFNISFNYIQVGEV